ncbi:NLRC3 [Branchiostoma lanceolatum]|uniref:NLRC3 protein n=1 Tax=Branchiostoma lanceolatum TaxID=7740 RepID=A0A8J9ZHZ3_BRALA|nr:NLRC3 [Branchiostoma lanceolatum]
MISDSKPAAVRPKEPPPKPADAPCRPPDPLYVRRVGQRFWSTKRILDWQRQALRAREDAEAVLKPVREYGEESALKGAEGEEVILKGHYENDEEHKYYQYDKNHGHYENDKEHKYFQYDKNHGHYENDGKHGHYENDEEHKYFQYDKNHGHHENDEEHKYFQYDKNHGHHENDEEHKYFQYDKNHGHYENDREHGHYENDREHGHYENDREHGHYENDREYNHYENDREHNHYENDREHNHYENDEEHSNLSTLVYADLDPDFLAAQDAIRLAAAQPFYEMDTSPADEEEQPFYKMDVTAAKDKQQQEQPFYEMEAASADVKDKPFYELDDSQLGQPTSDNVYTGLDPEYVAAQDAVRMRNRDREGSRDSGDDPRRSQNCRVFLWSRPGCMVGVCAGVVIAVIVATVVAVIFNQCSVLSICSEYMRNQTTIPTTSTITSAQLPVTSQATSWTTAGKDWQLEWTLYVREYFGENSDVATALEERYAANEVVMSLLQDRFFWPWVCRYWSVYRDLPCTLSKAVAYCVDHGTEREYMTSHGFSAYSEFFSSTLDALEALPNVTTSTDSVLPCHPTSLSLSKRTLSDNDVTALVNLFPYLEGTGKLYMLNCRVSTKAATSIAERLHLLSKLTYLYLNNNNIRDDGVRAIAETFPHLKEMREIHIEANSITNVGGEAMAKSLVHLQELQKLYLRDNELALSLSSLAKAFVNMSRLEYVDLFGVTCRAVSFRMAAQQARDAVHTIAGQVYNLSRRTPLLYDGSRAREGNTQELAWQRVKQELQTGVRISRGQLTVSLRIRMLEE